MSNIINPTPNPLPFKGRGRGGVEADKKWD